MSASLQAERVEEVREAVLAHPRLLPRGGGTKPALSEPPEGTVALELGALTGILEYDPEELTFTAHAGTPVREIAEALADNDQYLPFDPPFADSGATLGGTVAAGTSGPLRLRNGGVREFILGVRFIDGRGRLVSGGGRVVKNAAGFDLPKLLVGSIGRLGVMVDLSFKVFPAPRAWATLRIDCEALEEALELARKLATAPVDLEALDLEPTGTLWLRLAGLPEAMSERLDRLEQVLGRRGERLDGPQEDALWAAARDLSWAGEGSSLVKVALVPRRIAELEAELAPLGIARRYSSGGNLAWLACPPDRPLDELDRALRGLGLAGLVLTGSADHPLVGAHGGGAFARRVKHALDPDERFLAI